jgi:hypothetical protein
VPSDEGGSLNPLNMGVKKDEFIRVSGYLGSSVWILLPDEEVVYSDGKIYEYI